MRTPAISLLCFVTRQIMLLDSQFTQSHQSQQILKQESGRFVTETITSRTGVNQRIRNSAAPAPVGPERAKNAVMGVLNSAATACIHRSSRGSPSSPAPSSRRQTAAELPLNGSSVNASTCRDQAVGGTERACWSVNGDRIADPCDRSKKQGWLTTAYLKALFGISSSTWSADAEALTPSRS